MAEVFAIQSAVRRRTGVIAQARRTRRNVYEGALEGVGAVERHEAVALLRLESLPLARWSRTRAAALADVLQRIAADPDTSAVVLHGHEVFSDAAVQDAEAVSLALSAVADSPLPVFAAIEGSAIGVGLELALACAGRAATEGSRFAMPAVLSGRLPVHGGVSRLQSLVGADVAAGLIVFGESLDAAGALKAGVIDGVVAHGVARFAVALARSLEPRPAQAAVRACDRSPFGELPSVRWRLQREAPGQAAPLAAVQAMEAAVRLPPRRVAGEIEQIASRLARTAQGLALQHAWTGENLLDAAAAASTLDLTSLARRLAWPLRREAVHLLDEGASPAQVDHLLSAFGFASGPFAEADEVGLASVFSLTGQDMVLDEAWRTYSPTLDFMMDSGRTGGPQRPGWFRHGDADASRFDPEVERILTASALFQGLRRRRSTDLVLERRCLDAMISGSLELMDACPELGWRQVDALWTRRLGFPRWRGGPLYQGALAGWPLVLDRLEGQVRTLGPPSNRLRAWAEEEAAAPRAELEP